jgi:hypothetical protein
MIHPELQDAARGGVLQIDEASFLSARAGRWLLEFARDSGTRLTQRGGRSERKRDFELLKRRETRHDVPPKCPKSESDFQTVGFIRSFRRPPHFCGFKKQTAFRPLILGA